MQSDACLTRVRLRKLALGHLSEDEADEIKPHIEICPDCQEDLIRFDRLSDLLIDTIRNHARSPVPDPSPDLKRRLVLAEAIGPMLWHGRNDDKDFLNAPNFVVFAGMNMPLNAEHFQGGPPNRNPGGVCAPGVQTTEADVVVISRKDARRDGPQSPLGKP